MQTITDLGFAGDLALPSDTVEQETGNSLGFIHKRQKLAFISTLRKKPSKWAYTLTKHQMNLYAPEKAANFSKFRTVNIYMPG